MIFTINITSMMVLASIYLSVSSSLPSSSTIKPVEWWLLANLAYPFMVIIVNILAKVNIFLLQKCLIFAFSKLEAWWEWKEFNKNKENCTQCRFWKEGNKLQDVLLYSIVFQSFTLHSMCYILLCLLFFNGMNIFSCTYLP